jgi:CRP-like cAMP-binding protein
MTGAFKERVSREQKSVGRKFRFHQRSNLHDPENMILAALPAEEHAVLRQHLEFVPLTSRDVLWEPYQPIKFVYFPTSGMVSFIAVMRNGATAEVGITGREGFVGTAVLAGAREAPVRAIVQSDGAGFRIKSEVLHRLLPQTPQLEQALRRYAYVHAMQVAQGAACNCLHLVPERLARWLIMSYDCTNSDIVPFTQDFLAQMLGCRRASVTSAVGRLQKAGVIRPGHGQVRILDRKQLERRACECYRTMKQLSQLARAG